MQLAFHERTGLNTGGWWVGAWKSGQRTQVCEHPTFEKQTKRKHIGAPMAWSHAMRPPHGCPKKTAHERRRQKQGASGKRGVDGVGGGGRGSNTTKGRVCCREQRCCLSAAHVRAHTRPQNTQHMCTHSSLWRKHDWRASAAPLKPGSRRLQRLQQRTGWATRRRQEAR